MLELLLARWQFGLTTVYHFLFVPLTLGLVWVVAVFHTLWHRSGQDVHLRMTRFWGKLFLINFALGVVTGIVQEFQFGMNWSDYSRFVGDIFGAPLAIEALVAFFIESTFLGVWIFGWDRLPKRVHLASIWLVAIGSNLSALWILIANSFMQQPRGFVLEEGKARLVDFAQVVLNPNVLVQFPHVILGGIVTAGFFILGISAWHLKRSTDDATRDVFSRSFRFGAVYALVGSLLVMSVGHSQMQHVGVNQPMKMAAAEALWQSENPAALSLFTIGDEQEMRDRIAFKVPTLLSFLAYNRFDGEVKGIRELQAEYEQKYGPGDYKPPIKWIYWSFRAMVGAGLAMLGLALYASYKVWRGGELGQGRVFALLVPALALPYIANSSGWIMAEMGRQPWIVNGLMRIEAAVSPNVSAGEVGVTLVGFTLLYGVLAVADGYLLLWYARAGLQGIEQHDEPDEALETSKA